MSIFNFEWFIQNPAWPFLKDINEKYQQYKEIWESDEIDEGVEDRTNEIWKEGIKYVCDKLKLTDLEKIWDEHLTLSIAIGKPIGLMIKEPGSFTYPTMICEDILNAIY